MAAAATPIDPNNPDYLRLKRTVAGQVAQNYGADPAAPTTSAPAVSPDFAPTGSPSPKPETTLMGAPVIPPPSAMPGSHTRFDPASGYGYQYDENGNPIGDTGSVRMTSGYSTTPSAVTTQPVAPPQPLTPPAETTAPPPATTTAAPAPASSVEDAVAANYKTLGATPTGPGTGPTDAAYFIKRINETGGMTPENQAYWFGPNGRIARELRGEVPPEQGAAETPANRAASLAPPTSIVPAPAVTGTVSSAAAGKPANSTSGSNHTPGDGTGVPGVYDWNTAGYPVDAMGQPYKGALANGEANPWTTGGGTEGFPAGTTAAGAGSFTDQIRQQIMERLKAAGQPVDENASGIAGAVSAARDEATRASDQERTALAERLYAQGGGGLQSNALTQQIQQSGEKNAASIGGLRSSLILQEYQRKQGELDKLLSMAMASGDAESARDIQMQMAQLDATLRREGYSLDAAKYAAYLNQNAALAGLSGT